jgi:hypothetical protein
MDQKYYVMKRYQLSLLIVGFVFLQSCTIFSLHPLYHEEDLLMEPGLEGMWQDNEDGDEYVYFEQLDDKMYLFRYMEEQDDDSTLSDMDTVSFEAGLLRVGDHYFLDLYPYYERDKDEEADYLLANFIPTHSFLKIEWDQNKIVVYMFNYDRMKKLFEQNRIRIKHELIEEGKVTDYIVITASTDDLQRFIRKYANDPEAFDDPGVFIRMK